MLSSFKFGMRPSCLSLWPVWMGWGGRGHMDCVLSLAWWHIQAGEEREKMQTIVQWGNVLLSLLCVRGTCRPVLSQYCWCLTIYFLLFFFQVAPRHSATPQTAALACAFLHPMQLQQLPCSASLLQVILTFSSPCTVSPTWAVFAPVSNYQLQHPLLLGSRPCVYGREQWLCWCCSCCCCFQALPVPWLWLMGSWQAKAEAAACLLVSLAPPGRFQLSQSAAALVMTQVEGSQDTILSSGVFWFKCFSAQIDGF